MTTESETSSPSFRLEEATIAELHAAIRSGATTCVTVVQHYLARARAYNGVASLLLTRDGEPAPPASGAVRAGSALQFPTDTVEASTVLPDLDHYKGPPLEFGRMQPTASDASVHQQFGMIVGKPEAGQVNALATLNIRGERSVTCRGDFDWRPSLGPLPQGAPPVCEYFRHLPDLHQDRDKNCHRFDACGSNRSRHGLRSAVECSLHPFALRSATVWLALSVNKILSHVLPTKERTPLLVGMVLLGV